MSGEERLKPDAIYPLVVAEVARRVRRSPALRGLDSHELDDAVSNGVLYVVDYWWDKYRHQFQTGIHNKVIVKFAADRAIEVLVGELNERTQEAAAWELYHRLAPGPERKRPKPAVLELVQALVKMLADRERQVIELRYWEGLSYREIGERLGINASTAQRRERRALGFLKRWYSAMTPQSELAA